MSSKINSKQGRERYKLQEAGTLTHHHSKKGSEEDEKVPQLQLYSNSREQPEPRGARGRGCQEEHQKETKLLEY